MRPRRLGQLVHFGESGCLGMQPKFGGKLHLKLNTGTRPIANKYHEGKVKSTLKRESKRPQNRWEGNECGHEGSFQVQGGLGSGLALCGDPYSGPADASSLEVPAFSFGVHQRRPFPVEKGRRVRCLFLALCGAVEESLQPSAWRPGAAGECCDISHGVVQAPWGPGRFWSCVLRGEPLLAVAADGKCACLGGGPRCCA